MVLAMMTTKMMMITMTMTTIMMATTMTMTMTTVMTAQLPCKPPAPPIKLTQQATRNFWESFLSIIPLPSILNTRQCVILHQEISREDVFTSFDFFIQGPFLSHLQSLDKLSLCSGDFKRVSCRSDLKNDENTLACKTKERLPAIQLSSLVSWSGPSEMQ